MTVGVVVPVPGVDTAGECGGDAWDGLAPGVWGDSSCGLAELLRRGKMRGMALNVDPGRDGVGVFTVGGVDAPGAVGVVGVSSTGEAGISSVRSRAGGGTYRCASGGVYEGPASGCALSSSSSSLLSPSSEVSPSSWNSGPIWLERMVPMPSVCMTRHMR